MDGILNFLSNTSVILTIATILIIAFSRTIIRIFRMGATFTTQLATKQELDDFKKEMKDDMHGYAIGIQKAVMDACMKVIDHRFATIESDLKESKDAARVMTELKVSLQKDMRQMEKELQNFTDLSNTVRSLNTKVTRLEYSSTEKKPEGRRTE